MEHPAGFLTGRKSGPAFIVRVLLLE